MERAYPTLQSPVLLMIDFQRDFCEQGGYADHHGGIEWVKDILPAAKRLIVAARKAKIPVIHTREGYAPDLSDCHPNKLERSKLGNCEIGSEGPLGRLLIRGEPGHDHIQALYPINDELVIDKAGYCAFRDTELLNRLKAIDVKEILIAGVTADVCVHSTMRSSSENGFINFYIRDAISTFDPEIRKACERMVEVEGGIWGHLATVDQIERLLQ